MTTQLTFTLAQINPIVGDIAGNADKILNVWRDHPHTDVIVFSELCLCGFQPEDLVLHDGFMDTVKNAAHKLAEHITGDRAIIIGAPWSDADGKRYNAALFIHEGTIKHIIRKHHLPNDGVFDEKRTFASGDFAMPIAFKGVQLGIMICEDIWHGDVAAHLKDNGADILIALNGSPFEINKAQIRRDIVAARVKETGLPVIYTNQVGGQDDVVYDGGSFVMNNNGDVVLQMPFFTESATDIAFPFTGAKDPSPLPDTYRQIYDAAVLALKDYVEKNGFKGVLLGLSGGIDSAISAVIAVDALGADRVHCVMLPSPYTAQISLDDAAELAQNLGCTYDIVPIEPAMHAFETMIGNISGITAENIQSRARGVTLMAMSNATGKMVLSTGNKSEMAVGYATLYGDMCGGYNVLKDIYKTQVYALSHWRNGQSPVIPERIITRAPSAELRPDQTDQDSLPPYDILDAILEQLIEQKRDVTDIIAAGFEPDTVRRVYRLLTRAEYKRRQSAPGVKITAVAFGRDRRMPMTNYFENA